MSLIILDRDGVINFDSQEGILSPKAWIPIPGSLEAIASLNQAGYRVVVATNQSAIGRGLLKIATLNAIHLKMHEAVSKCGGYISAVFFCGHVDKDQCNCRKPKPGLLIEIAKRFNIQLSKNSIPFVGDALRDMQAAEIAGCMPHFILTGSVIKNVTGKITKNAEKNIHLLPKNTQIHQDLQDFAQSILDNKRA